MPDALQGTVLRELRLATSVTVERERRPANFAVRVVFVDGSADPFTIGLGAHSLDRLPAQGDAGRACTFSAWGRGPAKLAELPACLAEVP